MKSLLKNALASNTGWAASTPLRRRGVYVLMYHRVTRPGDFFRGVAEERFRAHMHWLTANCHPIGVEEILDGVATSTRRKPDVLVSFDDGYRDFHDRAYPVLREFGIPSVLFLSTQHMDRGGLLWTEALEWAVMRTKARELQAPWSLGAPVSLEGDAPRRAFLKEAKGRLKEVPDIDRRRWLDALLLRLDVSDAEETLGRQMMTWDEVRACAEGTCIGGHSHSHPILSRMTPVGMAREIRTCRERITEETGTAPLTFAYPNGRACDFNEDTCSCLLRHGFSLAFSTIPGVNAGSIDPLAMRRLHAWDSTVAELATLIVRSG